MQTARKRIAALTRLAMAEGASLLWPWGCAAALLVTGTVLLTDYLCPPFWFAARGELAATQATAATYLALLALILGWVWARHQGSRSAWLTRLDSTRGVIGAEAAGVAFAVVVLASVTSLLIIAVDRNDGGRLSFGHALSRGFAVLGLATLAPGLARLPVAKPVLVPVCAALVAGELGFLGSAFPLRVGRLWTRPDLTAWFPAPHVMLDLAVALAGLFVSLGIGRTVRRGS